MMTLDEIRAKRKAWRSEQKRLWRAFRASWTPEQTDLDRRYHDSARQLARLTLWQRRAEYPDRFTPGKQLLDPVLWPDITEQKTD